MRKSLLFIQTAVLLAIAIINPFILYSLPNFVARLLLILTFFVSLVYMITQKVYEIESASVVTFFSIAVFVFLQRNIIKLPPFFEGVTLSEIGMLAHQYNEVGKIVLTSAHSYFFQTPFLVYIIGRICGISPVYVSYIMIFCYIALIALVGLYILKITKMNVDSPRLALIPALLAFFMISSNSMLSLYIGYRDIGLSMLLLLMCYLFHRGHKRKIDPVVILLLIFGATLGSPIAALLMILFFSLFSVLWRRQTLGFYALVPLSYMIYAGYSYTLSLKRYATFAWEGFMDFFKEILSGKLPERVTPWERLTNPTREDIYVASATYLSLLLLSVIVATLLTLIWMQEMHRVERNEKGALLRSTCLCLWFALAVVVVAYVGASVKPEVPFSDIRTIVVIFISALLPFAFALRQFFTKISANKFLLLLTIGLLALSSLRTVYETYPKSIYDPINVVEDDRLSSMSVYYVGRYIQNFYTEGAIVIDYKTDIKIWPRLSSESYEKRLLSESALISPSARFLTKRIIVFDINGLRYPSLYIPLDVYKQAYNLSLTRNRLYDNGATVIVSG
jgi:hypothetical protein